MSHIPFIKMHGSGNDYIFVDGFDNPLPADPSELATQVSDRRFGIGSDGLICLVPPANDECDVEMRMWNADGTTGDMCGNGVRCVALWMALQNRSAGACRIRTTTRIVTATKIELQPHDRCGRFSVDMGCPAFEPDAANNVEWLADLSLPESSEDGIAFTAVSIGNPHAVIFTDALTDRNVRQLGAQIERHKRFPDRTNVEWVQVTSEAELQVRVWERGSGETFACGSGACAAGVAAVLRGFCARGDVIGVNMRGGRLEVLWTEDGPVLLSGPATVSFTGDWHLRDGSQI